MEQEVGRGSLDAIHLDDRKAFAVASRRDSKAINPHELEARLLKHTGEYCWMLCRSQPILDAEGRFKGYTGSAFDITRRKQIEDERDRALSLLNAIDLASPLGIAYYSTEFRLQHANPAYFEMFGFDPKTSIGKHVIELLGESRRGRTQRHFEEIMRGQTVPDLKSPTTERPGRPGEIGTFLVSYYPVSAGGRETGVTASRSRTSRSCASASGPPAERGALSHPRQHGSSDALVGRCRRPDNMGE